MATDEMYLGSDAFALAPFTDRITYLEDGDWAVVRRGGVEIYDADGAVVERAVIKSQRVRCCSSTRATTAISWPRRSTNSRRWSATRSRTISTWPPSALRCRRDLPFDFRALKRVTISACGTAYYAGMVGKYWFERLARLPVEIDIASEFRYREVPLDAGELALFVSQSGETADTLGGAALCQGARQHIALDRQRAELAIARESDIVMPTLAGPEIGVASTKAFTCQLAALACLAIAAGRARGVLGEDDEQRLVRR